MTPAPTRPITVALVDDYDVVVTGVANILGQYAERVVIAEISTNNPLVDEVDILLYDSFAQPESDHDEILVLLDNPRARKVVVYTWSFHPDLVEQARRQGVRGHLSKSYRHGIWWPRSRPFMPASSSSANRRPGPARPEGRTGPAEGRG